jgi:hypothetical protein
MPLVVLPMHAEQVALWNMSSASPLSLSTPLSASRLISGQRRILSRCKLVVVLTAMAELQVAEQA